MKWFKWQYLLIGMLMGGVVVAAIAKFKKIDLLDPLGRGLVMRKSEKEYRTVGFLPSWMVGKTMEYKDEIDRLVFLGIEVDEKGDLVWDAQAKKINNENYIKIKNNIRNSGGKNIIGIKQFDDEKLEKILTNEQARKNMVEQIKAVVVAGNFDGVNIDFEFMGNPTEVLENGTWDLVEELKAANVGEVSLDVFANTVIRGSDEKLGRMIGSLDYLVVMAYDFHRPGSTVVGPVAPIKSEVGLRNIMEVVDRVVTEKWESKKVILAYPLYGYEWKTTSTEYGVKPVKGWSAMASYKRVKEIISNYESSNNNGTSLTSGMTDGVKNLVQNWDEVSMTPWLSYKEDGQIFQIYYDDLRSLSYKFELAKDSQMGGVGFWALGYEGENKEIWKKLDEVMNISE